MNFNLSKEHLKISLEGGDFSLLVEDFSCASDTKHKVSQKTKCTIEIEEEAASDIRQIFIDGLVQKASGDNSYISKRKLQTLFSSLLPIVEYSDAGLIDISDEIKEQIETATKDIEINTKVSIEDSSYYLDAKYCIVAETEVKKINLSLKAITKDNNEVIEENSLVSSQFTLAPSDILDEDDGLTADTSIDLEYIFNRVVTLTERKDLNVIETFGRLWERDIQDIEDILDMYVELFNSAFQSLTGIKFEVTSRYPFVSHICGINPNVNGFMIIPINHTQIYMSGSRATIQANDTEMTYVSGDIQFPFIPVIGSAEKMFDICSGEPEWSKTGPLCKEYVGENISEFEINTMFSWVNRTSADTKTYSLSALGLDHKE